MIGYRLETRNEGHGFYRYCMRESFPFETAASSRWPTIHADCPRHLDTETYLEHLDDFESNHKISDLRYGFRNLESFYRWFDWQTIAFICRHNIKRGSPLVVRMVQADEYFEAQNQVLMNKPRAIHTFDLLEFMKSAYPEAATTRINDVRSLENYKLDYADATEEVLDET